MTDGFALGVDFGTSNTAAVLRWPDGTVKPLLFDGSELLPSGVCSTGAAPLLAGRDALNAARAHPEGFEPNPKRCIDDGAVQLAGAERPVVDLISAVLARVATEARRVAGAPLESVTLTCPAGWGSRRREVLAAAAAAAGLGGSGLVAEPVAAASYFVEVAGGRVPVGSSVVVYDFGAGTFDASVVRRTSDGFRVLAERGLDDAGGLDVDAAIVAHLGASYARRDQQLWQRLTRPSTPADRRAARQLWEDVRAGKEQLSRTSLVTIHIPLFDEAATLGREQLEQLAAPVLDRTVQATRTAIREAGVESTTIAGLFLVGGSSRIPLAATLLHRTLGIAPTVIDRPELVVAEGSLHATAEAAAPPQAAVPEAATRRAAAPEAAAPVATAAEAVQEPASAAPAPPRAPAPVRNPRRAWAVVAAVTVAVLAISISIKYFGGDGEPGPGPTGALDGPVESPGDCIPLNLVSSDEKAPALKELAERYRVSGRGIDGRCVDVKVIIGHSVRTAEALARGDWDAALNGPRPDVWSPSSSVWVERLRGLVRERSGPVRLPESMPSVTRTPVVIAMPEPMARALGWPKARIGWHDLVALAKDPAGWGAKGHPEWGSFTLGKTNPNSSTTGLHAMVATVSALLNDAPLTAQALREGRVVEDARALEAAAVHYGPSVSPFIQNLYQADSQGRGLTYVSAIALEEQVVWQYNRGQLVGVEGSKPPPRTKLAAIYPREGTMLSDNPYAILQAPWVDDTKRRAAEAFLAYTHEPEQKALFLDAGFRDEEDRAGTALTQDPGLIAEPGYKQVPAPDAAVTEAVLALWNTVRKPASVLMVIDVSGSMNTTVRSTGKTRLRLAQDAAGPAVDGLARTDEVGLWAFSSPQGDDRDPWRVPVPLGLVSGNAARYKAAVAKLRAQGDTALYATTRAAANAMRQRPGADRINGVVLLSDGANRYNRDNNLDRLLTDLAPENTDNPVRIFTIAYGDESDAATLSSIAQASRGVAYDARDPTTIQAVIEDVLSNF